MSSRFELAPSPLQLIGGPHSQPVGTLTAVKAGTQEAYAGTLSWSCSESKDFIFEPSGSTATVGAYRSCRATVTARDTKSGDSATATVVVTIMDGGLPGGR